MSEATTRPEPGSPAFVAPELPPAEPRPEPAAETPPAKPKARASTRAGRKAEAAANKAKREAAKGATKEAAPKVPAGKPAPRRASLEQRLAGAIASLGTGVAVAGAMTSEAVKADGLLVVEHAPNIAHALDGLAKDNPAVAVALERMLTAGAWSGVIAACTPVALGIAANHGMLPKAVLDQLGAAEAPGPAAGG